MVLSWSPSLPERRRFSAGRSGDQGEAARQPAIAPALVTDADLDSLPAPVARWLRRVGVVGKPRVVNLVVDMHAQLNRGPDQPWMETTVLQVSFVTQPTRLFLLRTRMKGLPVTGLHAYTHDGARMQIRVAGLVKEGRTSKEIAELLYLSRNTILFHRHNIRTKLDLRKSKKNLRSHLLGLEK
jgi:hypothetical protein